MSQPASSSNLSKSVLETKELIRYIWKNKWRNLVLILSVGLFSFYLLKFRILGFSATATFFVNDHTVVNNTSLENLPYGDNLNRIFQMVNSTQTQIHLIKKFDLYNHYGIDTTKEFHLQQAIDAIRSKIDVKKNPYNAINVTVSDKNRFLSAEMANEVVAYIETLNQEFYIKNIQNTLQLSQAYLSQLENESALKTGSIDSLIKDINNIISRGNISNSNLSYLLLQQQKLSELINIYETSTSDISNANKLYNLSLQTMNFKNFPTLSVIQTAMPDFRSVTVKAMLFSTLIMLLVFLTILLHSFYILHYHDHITSIINEK